MAFVTQWVLLRPNRCTLVKNCNPVLVGERLVHRRRLGSKLVGHKTLSYWQSLRAILINKRYRLPLFPLFRFGNCFSTFFIVSTFLRAYHDIAYANHHLLSCPKPRTCFTSPAWYCPHHYNSNKSGIWHPYPPITRPYSYLLASSTAVCSTPIPIADTDPLALLHSRSNSFNHRRTYMYALSLLCSADTKPKMSHRPLHRVASSIALFLQIVAHNAVALVQTGKLTRITQESSISIHRQTGCNLP